MYLNTMAFFTVYHSAAIVVIRRLCHLARDLGGAPRRSAASAPPVPGQGWGRTTAAERIVFVIASFATAFFFAWAETFFYMTSAGHANVWYIDLHTQLYVGSWFYAIYFVFTFPNIYRLDEARDRAPWSLPRVMFEATAMTMFVLFLMDLWTMFYGAPFAVR